MGWHYIAVKVKSEFGDGYEYTVGEAYPDLQEEGGILPHTTEATFFSETPEDLAKWLRVAADDIEKYGYVTTEEEQNELK